MNALQRTAPRDGDPREVLALVDCEHWEAVSRVRALMQTLRLIASGDAIVDTPQQVTDLAWLADALMNSTFVDLVKSEAPICCRSEASRGAA